METSTEALSYSLDALRVKALFYNKKAMVYVEGPEDINFWDPYFDRDVFEIESVNGCQNLKPYIEKLENGEKSFIVACDADYDTFKGKSTTSPLVVHTYGHSIENTMYCPHNLSEVVRKLSKSNTDTTTAIEDWYQKFTNSAHPLLLREIVNLTYKPHEDKPVVFGDTCANYCNTTAPCYELDDARIKKFCDENERFYPNEELERVEAEIQKVGRDERFLIKGHFLTDGVRRFVNFLSKNAHPTGSKSNISSNELYALCVHCSNCRIKDCEENKYIIMLVTNAIIHLEVA